MFSDSSLSSNEFSKLSKKTSTSILLSSPFGKYFKMQCNERLRYF